MTRPGRSNSRTFRLGFTLIELMLVSGLLAVLVGIAVVRLDGFSERGRLRSAGRQIGALYRLARFQALTEGRSRIMDYGGPAAEGRIWIRTPVFENGQVVWRCGDGFVPAGGVTVAGVAHAGSADRSDADGTGPRVWIGPDGVAPAHVVVLAIHGIPRAAVRIDGVWGEDELIWIPDAAGFEVRALLEPEHATRPDAR